TQHAKALAGLGALYLQTRELEKALNALQRAEAIDPNIVQMQYDLGLVLSSLGRPEEARVHMERFQKLKQQQPRGASNRMVEGPSRSEEHTSELQSRRDLVCRLLLEKKNKKETRCQPPHSRRKPKIKR